MAFRPQFPLPAAPPGYEWQPCVYQFDRTNTPYLANINLASGAQSPYIPLVLDQDAAFLMLGVRIEFTGLTFSFWDPFDNPLTDDFLTPSEFADTQDHFSVLENGVECPAGSNLRLRIQGV